MHVYQQKTGKWERNGVYWATGYSGFRQGKNNPAMEAVRGVGPVPRGLYKIGFAFTSKNTGPVAMMLTPAGHNALGRQALEIHGDSSEHPGEASHGCIILPRPIRERINADTDRFLQVI